MNIFGDVIKELFKMFVADLRLTLTILTGVTLLALSLRLGAIGPFAAGLFLVALCIVVLAETVLRETRKRRKN